MDLHLLWPPPSNMNDNSALQQLPLTWCNSHTYSDDDDDLDLSYFSSAAAAFHVDLDVAYDDNNYCRAIIPNYSSIPPLIASSDNTTLSITSPSHVDDLMSVALGYGAHLYSPPIVPTPATYSGEGKGSSLLYVSADNDQIGYNYDSRLSDNYENCRELEDVIIQQLQMDNHPSATLQNSVIVTEDGLPEPPMSATSTDHHEQDSVPIETAANRRHIYGSILSTAAEHVQGHGGSGNYSSSNCHGDGHSSHTAAAVNQNYPTRIINYAFPFMLPEEFEYQKSHTSPSPAVITAAGASLKLELEQLRRHSQLNEFGFDGENSDSRASSSNSHLFHQRSSSAQCGTSSPSLLSFRVSNLMGFRSPAQRRKRDLRNRKDVVIVPALGSIQEPLGDCIPPDSWTWRKYGQKPIKGSRHPRSYYRCTTVKGCKARKRVERWSLDPRMIEVTYFCDHTHLMDNNDCTKPTKISKDFNEHDNKNNKTSGDNKGDISTSESTSKQSNGNKNEALNAQLSHCDEGILRQDVAT